MEFKLCKFKDGKKGAYTLTFDDGCYYDSTRDVEAIFDKILERDGVKLCATVGITTGFMHERLINMWRELIDKGYFDIASHSVSHCICYAENTPVEDREKDACESLEKLKDMFYGSEIIAFIIPNGGSTAEGRKILEKYYDATRCGEERLNDVYNLDWFNLSTYIAMINKTTEEYIGYIDEALQKGGWGIQTNHWITHKDEDKFHSQRYDTFVGECDYIAKAIKEKGLWLCTFNEGIKYFRKLNDAKLTVTENDDCYVLDLGLENYKYDDTYLTVEVETDKDLTVIENGEEKTVNAQNGKAYLEIKNKITVKK